MDSACEEYALPKIYIQIMLNNSIPFLGLFPPLITAISFINNQFIDIKQKAESNGDFN